MMIMITATMDGVSVDWLLNAQCKVILAIGVGTLFVLLMFLVMAPNFLNLCRILFFDCGFVC